MLTENFSIILSLVCFLFTFIIELTQYISHRKYKQISEMLEYREFELNAIKDIKLLLQDKEITEKKAYKYLKILSDQISDIYPGHTIHSSIKVIEDVNKEKPENCHVKTWISYCNKEIPSKPISISKIKDNTDLSLIYTKNKKYVFVSDIKEYNTLNSVYKNGDKNYLHKWNSTIVHPIYKRNTDDKTDIIGFLCVDSNKALKNIKKNEYVIDRVQKVASIFGMIIGLKHADEK